MTVLRVCVDIPAEEDEDELCGAAVPVARPVEVDVLEEVIVVADPSMVETIVWRTTDLDVKSEVVKDTEVVEEACPSVDDVGDEVMEVSEVGDAVEVSLVEDDVDVGVLDGVELIERIDDGAEDEVMAAGVLEGADTPVPPKIPVTPPVICEMMEEASSEISFF